MGYGRDLLEDTDDPWLCFVVYQVVNLEIAVEHLEQRHAHQQAEARGMADVDQSVRMWVGLGQIAGQRLGDAETQEHEHVEDEEVGRDGEHLPRLLHAAQVAERDEGDEEDRDRHGGGRQPVERRPGERARARSP